MFYGVSRDAHVHSVRHRKADRRIRLQVCERGIRQSWCKPCYVEYKRVWYVENREKHIAHVRMLRDQHSAENQLRMWQYLAAHPCVDCGERDPVVLHFDHLRDERTDVSYMTLNGFKWDTILEEIAKCEIRCANCHMTKTAKERGLGTKAHDIAHAIRL